MSTTERMAVPYTYLVGRGKPLKVVKNGKVKKGRGKNNRTGDNIPKLLRTAQNVYPQLRQDTTLSEDTPLKAVV